MTAALDVRALTARGDFLELIDEGGIGVGLFWVTQPCGCRLMLWSGNSYTEARDAAAGWANTLCLPVLDRRAIN